MSKSFSLFPDLKITIPSFLLVSFSVLVLFSSDTSLATGQGIFAIVGFVLFYFVSLINFEDYHNFSWGLYVGAILLIIIAFIIGFETRGSVRWIPLGLFQIQPSEFAKIALMLILSQFWKDRLPDWANIGKSFLIASPILFLVFRQPDLGTALTLGVIWLFCLFGANISFKKLLTFFIFSLPVFPIANFFLKDYQKNRIESFLSPTSDPLGIGYNVIQSTIAVGSGGFLGRGLGRGTQSRLQFLPEYRTDFVFASIAEEMGFLACTLILVLYGMIILRILHVVYYGRSRFYSVLLMGVLGMLFFQMVVNIGMNIGIMPVTGITLPLLSYGGSSMIVTLVCLGFVASAVRFTKKGYIES